MQKWQKEKIDMKNGSLIKQNIKITVYPPTHTRVHKQTNTL